MMKKLLLVIGLFCSFTVNAHIQSGSLGESASATDIYNITCTSGNTHVSFDIFTKLPKGSPRDIVVSAELLGGKDTVTVSSPNNIRTQSADIQSVGIIVLVNKNKTGKATFTMQFHCMTASGVHNSDSTDINQLQNQ